MAKSRVLPMYSPIESCRTHTRTYEYKHEQLDGTDCCWLLLLLFGWSIYICKVFHFETNQLCINFLLKSFEHSVCHRLTRANDTIVSRFCFLKISFFLSLVNSKLSKRSEMVDLNYYRVSVCLLIGLSMIQLGYGLNGKQIDQFIVYFRYF